MKTSRIKICGILACLGMLIIILNGESTVSSVTNSIYLCLHTVIPALFPFFILSGIVNSCYIGQNFPFLKPIRRLCKIPSGTESILLIGLISGYPVGAQIVADAYQSKALSKKNAQRMLGFCSNAGPAFIFGILATKFSKASIPWILWGIHILSAIATGWLLPSADNNRAVLHQKEAITIKTALQIAIKNIATVCGWVVVFRIIIDFLDNYFLFHFPTEVRVLVSGFIELTNGCMLLNHIENESTRFILSATMLSFGGLCVAMQTVSVTEKIGSGFYFPGKLLQTLVGTALSCILVPFLFPSDVPSILPTTFILPSITAFTTTIVLLYKKSCSI